MPRSSRHKSSKHGSRDARDYSDSERDSGVKDRKGKDDSTAKASKDSSSTERRRLDSKDLHGSGNGEYSDEYASSSKRRKDGGGGGDRWNGGGEDDRGEGGSKKSKASGSRRRDEEVEEVRRSSGKHKDSSSGRKENREGGAEKERKFREGRSEDSVDGEEQRMSKQVFENNAMRSLDFPPLLLFSAIFRIVLILYGEWQDAHMEVRYTDVDYLVFSDAASLMASGDSPYKRTTYRYSPLLAFLLIPNSIIHRSWGKFLFSASDILVGYFIHFILKQRKVPKSLRNYSVMAWFFNPFTFTIGTRGNCEPIVCAMILWVIICLMKGNVLQSAFWYGLVVHFRIYPIIYSIPIILVLDPNFYPSGQKPVLRNWSAVQGERRKYGNNHCTLHNLLKGIFTRDRLLFGLVSGVVFLFCTGLFFYLYGWEFLNEALLYHLTRTDPRHNFSIYFYHIYLHYGHDISVVEKLISFLPQFLVQLVLIFCFALDLPFCLFVQTVTFVAFNKVITAQYFVWFFCLLPLMLPWSKMKLKWDGLSCILLWMGAQIHWLMWGYLLEFKGKNVFLQLWVASLVFLAANIFVLIMIICRHRCSSVFEGLDHANSKNVAKLE